MLNILFLQPDKESIRHLRTSLAHKVSEWTMYFVTDAESALRRIESTPIDVIFAGLPFEDGDSLMADVRKSFPEIIRIGLVEHAWPRRSGLSNFHQFLIIPFAVKELEVAVERSCRLRDLLRGEAMARTVGELGELPSAPTVYMKLLQTLDRPESGIDEIARVIEEDVSISAKVLQLVNSALFRTSREIATVHLAASFLGVATIKNLVLSTEVFCFFEKELGRSGFSMERMQSHSQLAAKISGELNLDKEAREAAIVAALLHDIGKLVLAWKMPDRFHRITAKAQEQHRPLYQVEEELWGITHAEVGAYLLGLWGLPVSITEAVAYHHAPATVPHNGFDTLGAVYVANLLAHEQNASLAEACAEWDLPLLADMGVADKLPIWRGLTLGVQ